MSNCDDCRAAQWMSEHDPFQCGGFGLDGMNSPDDPCWRCIDYNQWALHELAKTVELLAARIDGLAARSYTLNREAVAVAHHAQQLRSAVEWIVGPLGIHVGWGDISDAVSDARARIRRLFRYRNAIAGARRMKAQRDQTRRARRACETEAARLSDLAVEGWAKYRSLCDRLGLPEDER